MDRELTEDYIPWLIAQVSNVVSPVLDLIAQDIAIVSSPLISFH